jgi:Arc/MetJ-type ribon-helix-helix transcriptional regulator
MTIHVSKDVENTINAAVRSGQFASASEMIDKLVREYDRQHHPQALADQQQTAAAPAQSILEMVDELRRSVPPEEFAKLPRDGARQLDHYLYGAPKRPTS